MKMERKFGQLKLIDLQKIIDSCTEKWSNINLTEVNECVVRLGILEGEFHWHKHNEEDEFFFVVDGELILELENESITLLPNQGFTVPCKTFHRTRAEKKTIVLMVEKRTVNPRGD